MKQAEKFKHFIADNFCYFIVVVLCFAYILTGFFTTGITGKTIGQIIADGLTAYVLSTTIIIVFRLQGITNGGKDERVIETENTLGDNVIEINPDIEKLDDWCEQINIYDLRLEKSKILASSGLKYSDYFTEDGVAKDFMLEKPTDKYRLKDWKRKHKAYLKAVKFKIKPLTTTDLTTCSAKVTDPHDFGRDKDQYKREENAKNIISKLIMVFVFGWFTISMVTADWANVLWKLFQVCVYVAVGVIQMVNSYFYMTDEYRNGLIKKIRYLQKFKNYLRGEKNGEN